jgi:polyadenylate-binding protein
MNRPPVSTSVPPAEQSGSLYVGDLLPEVTEHMLFEIFQSVGPVSSVKICRDKDTSQSLGYGYVNFHNVADAERALDTMNFTTIRGKACRIMWVEKDKSVRENGVGNIFIKNLDISIDHKTLYDTFSMFGNIKSCKVATDGDSNSLGYGFVHYVDPASAKAAIEKINGMVIAEKKVEVVPYKPKSERDGSTDNAFTNIFVKNFPLSVEDSDLEKMCEEFGEVLSLAIPKNPDGSKKGFLFCNYTTHDNASAAITNLHGKEVQGHVLTAAQHKTKAQRKQELRALPSDVNLYVKNLTPEIDDAGLKELFSEFGTIKSAKVMLDNVTHLSRGFGFVVFETNEAASKAMADMNGKLVQGKELYVALKQTKSQRQAALAKKFQSRGPMGMPGQMPPHMMPRGLPMMMPPPFGRPMMPPHMMGPPMPQLRRPRFNAAPKPRPLDVERMISMDSKQQKQEMGERLYPLVQRIEPKLAGKITGMLLEMDTTELMMLIESSDDLLISKVNEAVAVLKSHADN